MRRPGTDRRGSYLDRARRKQHLLSTYGDGTSCACVHCGEVVTYDTLEADRIIPGALGGTYRRDNVQPSCGPCNRARGANPSWTPQLATC